jgi:PHD/YefM family antitoxin component YafN of YafNO toxin-antitoxin module
MPIKMETISQQTLYRDLDEILSRVSGKRIPTLVIKGDRPTVVIFPYETYQQWIAARERRLHQACRGMRTWVSKHAEALTGLDSVQLVRETRDSQ